MGYNPKFLWQISTTYTVNYNTVWTLSVYSGFWMYFNPSQSVWFCWISPVSAFPLPSLTNLDCGYFQENFISYCQSKMEIYKRYISWHRDICNEIHDSLFNTYTFLFFLILKFVSGKDHMAWKVDSFNYYRRNKALRNYWIYFLNVRVITWK